MRDNKLVLKAGFILSIVFILSFFAVPIASGGSDFNIQIYIQTSAGIERADSKTIENILFNYEFEIKKMQEYVSDESCSLRAEGGSLSIDEIDIPGIDLSFNIPLKNDGPGQGSLTAQKDRDRFSLDFEVTEILETNSEVLKFRASGEGKLNREKFNLDNVIITFDKINDKVEISSPDYAGFEIKDMQVSFTKGCFGEETNFYLIIIDEELKEPRTTEEIEALLEEHPEFIDAYEGLRNLNNMVIIPEFGSIAGILTLAGAVGIFFFVRRK
ncbi:MAG: hypothetical protein Q8N63_04565 [Nanoarchaeota archaeon]|nr:hypothetical protein [Nanoarchaeota archaeon]